MDMHMINKQWSTRPDDERFVARAAFAAYNTSKRERAIERGAALEHLRVGVTSEGEGITLADGRKGPSGGIPVTHWAFGQLAQRAHAPAGYLRSLPAMLAAPALQWSLEQAGRADCKVLVRREESGPQVAATTGPDYGRIYDADVSDFMERYLPESEWKVPAASYASSDPKRATTLYASDRDMFAALVDDSRAIEVPGTDERLYRGIILRNSEVGAATLEVLGFLYRFICDNRIIWGGREAFSLSIRHTSGGPVRWLREAQPTMQKYIEASTTGIVDQIQTAQAKTVAKDKAGVVAWLRSRGFDKGVSETAFDNAQAEDGLDPTSAWGIVQGLTGAAHSLKFGDERLDLERQASKILEAF